MGCASIDIKSSDFLAWRLGAMEQRLAKIFRNARAAGNAVLIFDEADSVVSSRATTSTAGYIVGLTNSFLVELDAHSLPVIFATNYPGRVDAAIMRRCDLVVEVKNLPEELEHRAYRPVLGIEPSPGWTPIGQTTVSDYVAARRMARLTGDATAPAAADAIRRARDV